jgi:transposase
MTACVQILRGKRRGDYIHRRGCKPSNGAPHATAAQANDLSRSLIALDMDTTLIAVVELSLSSWLVADNVPGVERQPLKKLKTDENALLALLHR